MIGVDTNSGFITVAETDRFGSIMSSDKIDIPEVGRTVGRRDAARGHAVKIAIGLCHKTGSNLERRSRGS